MTLPDAVPNAMTARATSPDGNIEAVVTGRTAVRVTFRSRTFTGYAEPRLSHQLSRLGTLTWLEMQRHSAERHRRLFGHDPALPEVPDGSLDDPRERRYHEELRMVEALGQSPSGAVRLRTRGMVHWDVTIAPGAPGQLGEPGFVAELHAAIAALLADRTVRVTLLKARYFDLGLPTRWRDLTRDLLAGRPR